MEKMANLGYFGMDTDTKKEVVKKMMSSLNAIYPDRWSFNFTTERGLPDILIHFPEFQIRNAHDDSHTIRDLYVILSPFFDLKDNLCFKKDLYGFRTTLTELELYSGYQHSHLPSRGNYLYRFKELQYDTKFCLGSSEVVDLLLMLNSTEFDSNLFELFLLTLDSYVKWESLDGGPYIKISNIKTEFSVYKKNFRLTQDEINLITNLITENTNFLKKASYTFSNNLVQTIANTDFVDNLKKLFIKKDLKQYLCVKEGIDYYTISEKSVFQRYSFRDFILFRGSVRKLKVIRNTSFDKDVKENINNYEIFPPLLDSITSEINLFITKKYIQHNAKKRELERARKAISLFDFQQRNHTEDTVSMQYNPF